MSFLYIALGVALLYGGGEALVAGAKSLARLLGISPLVIGLTVVAFATSTPELAATLTASLTGSPEVGFGNVVGSNIANLALVLPVAVFIFPLAASGAFLRREMPFMLAGSALMLVVAWDGVIGRAEATVLLLLLAGYLWVLLRGDRESPEVEEVFERAYGQRDLGGVARGGIGVAVGVVLLVVGAQALVTGAVAVARQAGVSERVVGLTLVALGTSLPELASTIVAAARREGDIILGNLVGSNIFNILFVLGASSLVHPMIVEPGTAEIDLLVMLGISILCWPLMMSGRLGRRGGAMLLAAYVAYVTWLFV